jgi:N-methylhydantoinase B
MENEYPLHCEEYGLAVDSGGAGRTRGGLGIVRQIRAVVDDTIFSARADSYIHGAEGIDGGRSGGLTAVTLNPGRNDERELPTKIANLVLREGQSVRIETPGAGGFGPCEERPLDLLARDLRDGIVSRSAAERDYGAARVEAALAQAGSA